MNDFKLFRQSNWEDILENALVVDATKFYIYGERSYLLRPCTIRPFICEFTTNTQLEFITRKSSIRVVIDKNYRDLKQLWCSNE